MLNDAAVANTQALGGVALNFAEMQKTITEAMQNASRQVTTAVEEMRKRMTDPQEETRQAMSTAPGSRAAFDRRSSQERVLTFSRSSAMLRNRAAAPPRETAAHGATNLIRERGTDAGQAARAGHR